MIMSNAEALSEIPDIHPHGAVAHNSDVSQPIYEKVRGLENALTKGFLSQFEQTWSERHQLAETATQALKGDRAAQQALGDAVLRYAEETGQTLRELTQSDTWQQLAQNKMQDIQAVRNAYQQAGYDDAAKLMGVAIAGAMDLKSRHAHHDMPTAHDDHLHHRHGTDRAQDFTLSPDETIQIGDRTFTHEDQVEHILIRGPLHNEDLVPIDDHDPLAPEHPQRAANSQAAPEGHALTTIGIVGTVGAGLGVAGYELHQRLSHAERKHDLELSVAYKATMQLVENQSDENRNGFYDISLRSHPELQQAFAGYEQVRSNLNKDGVLNDQEKAILDMVVFTTNLNILDGRIDRIRVDALEFSEPGHERTYYEEKAPPTR